MKLIFIKGGNFYKKKSLGPLILGKICKQEHDNFQGTLLMSKLTEGGGQMMVPITI